jgi:hypothetical protein
MRIILHCGLAKTGTTFLQENCFIQEDMKSQGMLYNPNELLQLLIQCIHYKREHGIISSDIVFKVNEWLRNVQDNKDPKVIFCSYEPLGGGSGSAWEFHSRVVTIKEILPDSEIIVALRYQTDWLVSLYKQHIHGASNPYKNAESAKLISDRKLISIKQFLNYDHGRFKKRNPSLIYQNIGIHDFHWGSLVRCLNANFEKDQWNLFFYEDFVASPKVFVDRFLKAVFGPEYKLGREIDFHRRANKGFSLFAIKLTGLKFYLATFIPFQLQLLRNFDSWLAGKASHSDGFYGKFFRGLRHFTTKFFLCFSWLSAMRTIDRIFENKSNILEDNFRNELDQEFNKMNQEFVETLKEIDCEIKIPEKYTSLVPRDSFDKVRS